MLSNESMTSSYAGNSPGVRFGQGQMQRKTSQQKKGPINRNFSLSIRAHDEKALIEFPLDSVREENDNFDEVEREYRENEGLKTKN